MGCIYSLKWRYTRNHHSPEEGCSLESRRCWFTVHPSVTVMLFNVVANLWYWNEMICCFHNKSCWKGDGFLVCSYSNAPNFWCVHVLLEVLGFFLIQWQGYLGGSRVSRCQGYQGDLVGMNSAVWMMPTLLLPLQCLLGTSTITGGAEGSFHLNGQDLHFLYYSKG